MTDLMNRRVNQSEKDHDTCEVFCYDEEKVNRLKGEVEITKGIASLFKALADDTRIKIAYALCREEELCVCDVANIIGSTAAAASHHLRLLRNMGLAKYRKEGKLVFYSLDDEHVKQLILTALAHTEEGKAIGESPK
ncbi:ArsR/SmtB family transcription factor [Effusibacillus pohliae]|uniref:ArsR/SmtB family transcription factor n=1 Tax=Effusibacillus pohliae TaxID=232270 RepID=UPI000368D5F0|nr:metalloregulator ArsR/SmtB family transcription factor [Effusibacillus pohliae]